MSRDEPQNRWVNYERTKAIFQPKFTPHRKNGTGVTGCRVIDTIITMEDTMRATYMKTAAAALAIVIAAAFAAPNLFAQQGKKQRCPDCERHHRGPWFGNLDEMKERLGLSDEQVDKISAINTGFKKRMLDHREKMAPKTIQLKKLLLEDDVNIGKVRSLLKEIYDIKIEVRVTMIEHRLAIEKVLTDKQKNLLREERMKMRRHGPPMRDMGYGDKFRPRPAGYDY